MSASLTLQDLGRCFAGAVPAVIATCSADGTPNVTYLSRVHRVDDERVALSNQFFSKTARNLAENPQASVLLIDPTTYDEYRLRLTYERTDRRGPVFDRLREDVDVLAALEGMQDVFKLRAADIYRVVDIQHVPSARVGAHSSVADQSGEFVDGAAVAELTARLGRCGDLDTLVDTALTGLADLLGHEHSLLMLIDTRHERLFTIASHGYAAQGVGSEAPVGEGLVGMAAARCQVINVGNVRQMAKYSRTVRRSYEDAGEIVPGAEIPVPGLVEAKSRIAVPAVALGQLVGVLVVESTEPVAFGDADEATLRIISSVLASAIEAERSRDRAAEDSARVDRDIAATRSGISEDRRTRVRFYAADGSTFLDDEYLIKGVAGRLLWSLLRQNASSGRTDFTNREVRLDPSLELPEFRDNFESRLILLKRRLDERDAPIRIAKTGRGRFRLDLDTRLQLEQVE